MTARIALIGLSGAGKTTVAPVLAGRLGFQWADLDALIETRVGTTVGRYIQTEGEAAFRERESAALRESLEGASDAAGLVLACGAGVLGREENRRLLRGTAFTVWLSIDPDTAARRLEGAGTALSPAPGRRARVGPLERAPGSARVALPGGGERDRGDRPEESRRGRRRHSGDLGRPWIVGTVRIVGGSLRGRRLRVPDRGVRPTSERTREAIFDILGAERLEGASVLELFAGTGALGIEALSRGARSVDFVEGNHARRAHGSPRT